MYCVYLHCNKINNKRYVGQTKHGDNPNKRWLGGYGYRDNQRFFSDIMKYGWDNFSHTILADNLTLDEANELERKYIAEYQSANPKYGYNMTPGGGNYDSQSLIKSKDCQFPFTKTISITTTWYNDENGVLRRRVTLN